MMESFGAACHHLAQPMTSVLARLDMLVNELPDSPQKVQNELELVLSFTHDVAKLLHQFQNITHYSTQTYAGESQIVDVLSAGQQTA